MLTYHKPLSTRDKLLVQAKSVQERALLIKQFEQKDREAEMKLLNQLGRLNTAERSHLFKKAKEWEAAMERERKRNQMASTVFLAVVLIGIAIGVAITG